MVFVGKTKLINDFLLIIETNISCDDQVWTMVLPSGELVLLLDRKEVFIAETTTRPMMDFREGRFAVCQRRGQTWEFVFFDFMLIEVYFSWESEHVWVLYKKKKGIKACGFNPLIKMYEAGEWKNYIWWIREDFKSAKLYVMALVLYRLFSLEKTGRKLRLRETESVFKWRTWIFHQATYAGLPSFLKWNVKDFAGQEHFKWPLPQQSHRRGTFSLVCENSNKRRDGFVHAFFVNGTRSLFVCAFVDDLSVAFFMISSLLTYVRFKKTRLYN